MVITAIIVMNLKIIEPDLQDARLRHQAPMEYQIMDLYPDLPGNILNEKNDVL